jgi:diguanylate cyclase (GGDEF)-like protein
MKKTPARLLTLYRLLDWSDRDKCLLLSVLLWGYMGLVYLWHLFTVHFTDFARQFVSAEGAEVMNQVMILNQVGWLGLIAWGSLLRRRERHSRYYPVAFMSFFSIGFLLLAWTVGFYSPMTGMVLMGSPLVGFILFGFPQVAWNFAFSVLVVLLLAWLSVLEYSAHAIYFITYPITREVVSYYWVASTVAFMVPFIATVITLISLLLRRWIYREAQIRDQAVHDPLTGLANRRELFRLLAHELARGRRSGLPMAICIMDLDHFKRINDQYGHGAGDRVLVKMAETLNACLRESDLVGRIGGEEFVLVMPETDADGAANVLERCRDAIASTKVILDDGGILHVTASFGAIIWLADAAGQTPRSEAQLLSLADQALYQAKEQGRNRVLFWQDAYQTASSAV